MWFKTSEKFIFVVYLIWWLRNNFTELFLCFFEPEHNTIWIGHEIDDKITRK